MPQMLGVGSGTVTTLYGVAVLVGIVHVLYGFRIFKIIMAIQGFLVGGYAGYFVAEKISAGSNSGHGVGILVGGLVGLVVLVLLWKIGVFVLGAGFGVAACTALLTTTSTARPEPVVLVGAGALGGGIALLFSKLLIILSTSLLGALAITAGAGGILGDYSATPENGAKPYDNLVDFFDGHALYLYCALGIAVLGVIAQTSKTARDRHYE